MLRLASAYIFLKIGKNHSELEGEIAEVGLKLDLTSFSWAELGRRNGLFRMTKREAAQGKVAEVMETIQDAIDILASWPYVGINLWLVTQKDPERMID